jgi:hypothetical protein
LAFGLLAFSSTAFDLSTTYMMTELIKIENYPTVRKHLRSIQAKQKDIIGTEER